MSNEIPYPYLPEGRTIKYTTLSNPWMQAAKQMCDQYGACSWWPTGAVLIKNNLIIGRGANSGTFYPVCPRVEKKCPSGTGYELCQDICKQDAHAEITCPNDAVAAGNDTTNADIYLFGHWWCCKPCWDHMIKHGIRDVYLLENAYQIFTSKKRLKVFEVMKRKHLNNETVEQYHAQWIIE